MHRHDFIRPYVEDLARVFDMDVIRSSGAPIGGVKVVAEQCWFAARPSGTEEIYKIYAESFRSEAHLREVQYAAHDALAQVLGQSNIAA